MCKKTLSMGKGCDVYLRFRAEWKWLEIRALNLGEEGPDAYMFRMNSQILATVVMSNLSGFIFPTFSNTGLSCPAPRRSATGAIYERDLFAAICCQFGLNSK
jgi:hypothetical protein